MEQLSFDGFEPPAQPRVPRPKPAKKEFDKPPHGLFLALLPPESNATLLHAMGQHLHGLHGLKCKLQAESRLHATVLGLEGSHTWPPQDGFLEAVEEAAASIRQEPFELVFDLAMSFKSSYHEAPFVLCSRQQNPPFERLRDRLHMAMKERCVRSAVSNRPHVTLSYGRKAVRLHPVESIRWTATEVKLIHSYVGHTRHEVLGAWPLRA